MRKEGKMNKRLSKRILAMMLSFAVVFSMIPGVVFAETDGGNVIEISTAEAFATMDAGGNYKLVEDIKVTAPYANDFSGTFDGGGHTITLDIVATAQKQGLFASLAGGAYVKNIILAGKVESTGNYVGSVAGFANTYEADITIENCKNTADITGKKGIGGILGNCAGSNNDVTIRACANTGNITGANNHVGGIVGNLEGTHKIINCYNQGNIIGFNNYAGIAGRCANSASLTNCYTTGIISAYGDSKNEGYAIVGGSNKNGATADNCYALVERTANTLLVSGITGKNCLFKSSDELKEAEFAKTLGSGFMAKAGDFPKLAWEIPTASVNFSISPEDTLLTVLRADQAVYTSANGATRSASLPAGEYTYRAEREGYAAATGSFSVSKAQADAGDEINVGNIVLSKDSSKWATVTFNITGSDKYSIEVKDENGNIQAGSSNSYELVKDKTYSYTVTPEEEAVESSSGQITVNGDITENVVLKTVSGISISSTPKTEFYVGDKFNAEGLKIKVAYTDNTEKELTEGFEITGFDSSNEMSSQTITVSYKGKTTTYDIKINAKPFPSTVFNGLAGKATVEYSHNNSFKGNDGEEFIDDETEGALQSNSMGMGSSQVTVTIKFNENLSTSKLKFQYKVSSEKNYDYFKINEETGKSISGNIDWTEKVLTVKGGDTVTLAYVKDYSGNSGSDCVWLKLFALEELHAVTLNLNPTDADITLTKEEETDVINPEASDEGSVRYSLENGTYSYTVSKFGYVSQTGQFTVADNDITKDISLVMSAMHSVSFRLTLPENITSDSEITVKSGDNVITPETDGKYKLPAGEYTYTITNPYCEALTGNFTVADSDIIIEKTLTRKLVFNDFFDNLDGITAKNDKTYPYEAVKGENENYLRSSKNIANYGKASIQLTATKNLRLSFEYLGSNSSSSSYPFTIKKAGTKLLESYDKTMWETFSTDLKNGEALTLTFEKPYSYGSTDYCVKLKNFSTTPVYSVKIISATAGADIVLKDKKNNVIDPVSSEYLLIAGEYSYTVSKFGYETKTGTLTVSDKDENINLGELKALDTKKIRFNVNVNDAKITVTHKSGVEIEPQEGVYLLPAGEYEYKIEKDGYITTEGAITATEDKTINIELVYAGEAWDGTTKTEPAIKDGIYQISNAAELAWIADKVNDGDGDINAALTNNINLNNKTWNSFGKYDYSDKTKGFAGVLNGNGYTVSGLQGAGGIIDCLAAEGVVKNLHVYGAVAGSGNIGGIANTSYGTIENCMFGGSITNSSNYGSTGGIVGRALDGNTVRGCVNKAGVKNTTASYSSTLNIGGIAGYTYGNVENSYNIGAISAKIDRTNKAIGGIAGAVRSGGTIVNSYSAGKVTGPEAGIGAVAGSMEGTGSLKNVYYNSDVCKKAVAEGQSAAQAKTADEMKAEEFVSAIDPLNEHFNRDTANINSGYPVLKWQGGTPVEVSETLKELFKVRDSLVIKQRYTKQDTVENEEEYFSMIAAQNGEKEWNIDTICEHIEAGILEYKGTKITEEKLDWYLDSIYEDYAAWLAEAEEKELTAEADGKYILESSEALVLVAESGNGVNISWSSSNPSIIDADGNVALPENGAAEVILTAVLSKDDSSITKEFSIEVKSEKSKSLEYLNEIKAKLEKNSAFIQPFEIYDHTNAKDAMEFYLNQNGYDIDENEITVQFISKGSKTYPATGSADNIGDDGSITYFTGSDYPADNYANYRDVEFKLKKDGQEVTIKTNVRIGWSFAKVKEMTDAAIAKVTWEAIKGANTNTSTVTKETGLTGVQNSWETVTIDGQVAEDLALPTKDSAKPQIKIQWSSRKDTDALAITENEDGSYTAKLKRPRYGSQPRTISIKAEAYFDGFDEYTKAQFETPSGKSTGVSSIKMFTMTLAPETEDVSVQLQKNLEEKYEGLLREFVDKNAEVNTGEVSKDLQMPRPATLTEAGIMDRDIMKVKMESGNTDVLDFYGYHAQIYRPLPGEPDVTVPYTIKIVDYYNESDVYAEKTFYLTIKAFDKKELDNAKAFMSAALTEEAYWNGIKGNNTDKNNVTSDMAPFVEILQGENGELEYTRGTANITFGGIDVDDLDGWYLTEKFREFKSSKPSVVAHETLKVTQPEYNTKVKIQSVLTHSDLGKYWKKFGNTAKATKYAEFQQFYMQPISTEIIVTGTAGTENPNPDTSLIKATVSIDGKGAKGFKNLPATTVYDLDAGNATAWDAVSYALLSSGYKYTSVGSYIASVTDTSGVTLSDEDSADSGWLYTVNGTLPNVYMGSYELKNNDVIELYYTGNWKEDPNAGQWTDQKKEVITTGTDVKITTVPTEVKVSGSTATATVTDENAAELVKQARENKSAEIVLNVSSSDTDKAETVNLELTKKTLDSIVNDTDAAVTVKTQTGEINLDKETLKQINSEAAGDVITIEITRISKPEETHKALIGADGQMYRLTVKSGDSVISQFKGYVTVRLAIPAVLKDRAMAAVHIKDGSLEKLDGRRITQDKVEFYEFKTPHFSEFALVDTDQVKLDADDTDNVDKAKSLVKELKLTAASSKTAKKNVKITVKMNSKNNALIKELKGMGYTVKYKYYRSTKKASKYSAVKTKTAKTYINTKGKKGSRYYYKARVMVYDGDKLVAQSALGQCRYAVRVWSK